MTTAERIAAAALAILNDEGVAAVTMRRVAADAGLSTMAAYRHYPNREELLRAVADAGFAALAEDWGRHPRHGDLEAQLKGLMDDFLDLALGRPHLYRFLLTDRRTDVRRFPEGYRDSPAFRPVLDAVERWMHEGLLGRDDPVEVAVAITAPSQGLVQLYLNGRIGLSESEFRALVWRTLRRVLDGIRS